MATECMHVSHLATLSGPKLSQSVNREECTQCFDNQDGEAGIDLCLSCFNGGCLSQERRHARTHAEKTGHTFALNIKRRPKPSSPKRSDIEGPPSKMAKLAIVEEREEDKFDHIMTLKCWSCERTSGRELPELSEEPKVKELVREIMASLSSARQSEVKAWEEEIEACEHTLLLEQSNLGGPIQESGLAQCSKCDLKENLWLCLTCGSLGCGRPQYGGLGGNGHGLAHYEESRHPVSVKLGTITPEGTADIYCYVCNDAKLDLDLPAHLATFGINISTQTKTEKTMTELQIEHNLKFDFSMTDESGKALQPVFGQGLTGLVNLGNSCYMASVVQALFSLPDIQNRYLPSAERHWQTCQETLPASCLECQMHKLADGLLSGRYSRPRTVPSDDPMLHDSPAPVFQEGVKPATFKALIGKGHQEFATMRQQDAEEFFSHLLSVLRQNAKKRGIRQEEEPTEIFTFGLEQRLQCRECQRVRYRIDSQDALSVPVPAREKSKDEEGRVTYEDVPLKETLDLVTGDESLEYQCPGCNKEVFAVKRARFSTFPKVLILHAKKFKLVNWVPAKLDIPLILPDDDELVLDPYFGEGLQPGEIELPEDVPASAEPAFNEAALSQLEAMGFPQIRCKKALLATGNADPEAAMEWLFAHMEDHDIDDPLPAGGGALTSELERSAEQINIMLIDMGFTTAQAKKALRETGGNSERAVDWLFNHPDDTGEETPSSTSMSGAPKYLGGSATLPARYRLKAFISHKGPSVQSGHYVAHIKTEKEGWVLFNDEKVVRADEESVRELKKLAYLYVFERM